MQTQGVVLLQHKTRLNPETQQSWKGRALLFPSYAHTKKTEKKPNPKQKTPNHKNKLQLDSVSESWKVVINLKHAPTKLEKKLSFITAQENHQQQN